MLPQTFRGLKDRLQDIKHVDWYIDPVDPDNLGAVVGSASPQLFGKACHTILWAQIPKDPQVRTYSEDDFHKMSQFCLKKWGTLAPLIAPMHLLKDRSCFDELEREYPGVENLFQKYFSNLVDNGFENPRIRRLAKSYMVFSSWAALHKLVRVYGYQSERFRFYWDKSSMDKIFPAISHKTDVRDEKRPLNDDEKATFGNIENLQAEDCDKAYMAVLNRFSERMWREFGELGYRLDKPDSILGDFDDLIQERRSGSLEVSPVVFAAGPLPLLAKYFEAGLGVQLVLAQMLGIDGTQNLLPNSFNVQCAFESAQRFIDLAVKQKTPVLIHPTEVAKSDFGMNKTELAEALNRAPVYYREMIEYGLLSNSPNNFFIFDVLLVLCILNPYILPAKQIRVVTRREDKSAHFQGMVDVLRPVDINSSTDDVDSGCMWMYYPNRDLDEARKRWIIDTMQTIFIEKN